MHHYLMGQKKTDKIIWSTLECTLKQIPLTMDHRAFQFATRGQCIKGK